MQGVLVRLIGSKHTYPSGCVMPSGIDFGTCPNRQQASQQEQLNYEPQNNWQKLENNFEKHLGHFFTSLLRLYICI